MLKNSQRTSRKGGTTPAWSPADPLPMDSPSQPPSPSPHLCPWTPPDSTSSLSHSPPGWEAALRKLPPVGLLCGHLRFSRQFWFFFWGTLYGVPHKVSPQLLWKLSACLHPGGPWSLSHSLL